MENNKKYKTLVIVVILIVLCVAGYMVVSLIQYNNECVKPYKQAIEYIYAGKYKDAIELLSPLSRKEFADSEDLTQLCSGILAYERGDLEWAWYRFKKLDYLEDLTAEENAQIDEFLPVLKEEYWAYLEAELIAEQKATDLKITTGVPYVGMPESRIDDTILGRHDDTRTNFECISGEQYLATVYVFMEGNKEIFSARCVRGSVTEVWDWRDSPAYVSNTSSNTTTNDDDRYDAASYRNADDFYYDHYDDFFDYYDAENYYREHHD